MKPPRALLLLLAFFLAGQAHADLITFDDLPGAALPVPNGYNNYSWDHFYYLAGAAHPPSGYDNSVVSPTNIAYNYLGLPATISSAEPFALGSGYFTAAWMNGLTITVVGSGPGGVVFDNFQVDTTGPTLHNFGPGFQDLTSVTFLSSGGTPAGFDLANGHAPYTQFALDNLTVTHVPEPSTLALLGLAVSFTSLYAWRQRRGRA